MRTTILATAALLAFSAISAAAAQDVPLEHVAAVAGYRYEWSAAGAAAVLSRPGIYVVMRPGAFVYQVNDHDEVTKIAPKMADGEMFVDGSLARHLEALARSNVADAPAAVSAPYDRAMQGSLTLEARQLLGAEAIDIEGTAPAGAPVSISLFALLSPDLPTVLVSRHDIVPDVNGRFKAVIPIASAYERGTVLRVIATSSPGLAPAQAQLVVGPPNPDLTTPLYSNP